MIGRRAHRGRRNESDFPIRGIRGRKQACFRASRDRSGGGSSRLLPDGACSAAGMSGSLSRNIAPAGPAPASDNWIVSETTSPVNYTPIVIATTFSRRGSKWLPDATLHSLPWRPHRTGRHRTGLFPQQARITPYPTASMTISRCGLRQPRHRLEQALLSRATSYACCNRFPSREKSPSVFSSRTAASQQGHFLLGGLKMVREKSPRRANGPTPLPGHATRGHRTGGANMMRIESAFRVMAASWRCSS